MGYTLCIQCPQETGQIRVNQQMSFIKIMQCIEKRFCIATNYFKVQVYDCILQKYIDFDEEYAEELRHITQTWKDKTVCGRVVLEAAQCINSTVDNTPSPLPLVVNSPGGMSVADELRSTTPDIDLDLCVHDETLMLTDEDYRIPSFITFGRDVAPFQRTPYQIQQDFQDNQVPTIRKKNFTIRIEGVKTESDPKYASILPEIKFPPDFCQQKDIKLVVAVVLEERSDNLTKWRLNTKKGFLYDDAKTDRMPYNPICLDINQSEWTDDGIYKLPLRMCTIAGSQTDIPGCAFHTLNSNCARRLHPADHLPNTSRLACAISDESGNIYWNTFGLSDYMRPKCYQKRTLEETNPVTNDFNSPPKRVCSRQNQTGGLTDSKCPKTHQPGNLNPALSRSEILTGSCNLAYQQRITSISSSHTTTNCSLQNIKQIYENYFSILRNVPISPIMTLGSKQTLRSCCQFNQNIELNFAEYYLQNLNCFPVAYLPEQAFIVYYMGNLVAKNDYFTRDAYNRFNRLYFLRKFDRNDCKLLDEFINRFFRHTERYRVKPETS